MEEVYTDALRKKSKIYKNELCIYYFYVLYSIVHVVGYPIVAGYSYLAGEKEETSISIAAFNMTL